MLPNIGKIDLTKDKTTLVQLELLDVVKHLRESGSLNFEYSGQIGDPECSALFFKAVTGASFSQELSKRTAKVQSLGGQHGIFIFSYLIGNYYKDNARYYLPGILPASFDAIKAFDNPVEFYEPNSPLKFELLGEDSILVFNPFWKERTDLASVFGQKEIQLLNSRNIFVLFEIGNCEFSKFEKKTADFNELVSKTFEEIARLFSLIDNVGLNIDTCRIFCMEGLNFGHLFIKFPESSEPGDFEKCVGLLNRTSLSTPVKLGLDILKTLLTDQKLTQKVVRQLTLPECV